MVVHGQSWCWPWRSWILSRPWAQGPLAFALPFDMKRNWDTIRSVLEEVEGLGEQQFQGAQYSYGQDTPTEKTERVRHLFLLHEAGFIKGNRADMLSGLSILSPELTWEGHELLNTIRPKTVWNKVKTIAQSKGLELSFDAVKALGKVALAQVLDGNG